MSGCKPSPPAAITAQAPGSLSPCFVAINPDPQVGFAKPCESAQILEHLAEESAWNDVDTCDVSVSLVLNKSVQSEMPRPFVSQRLTRKALQKLLLGCRRDAFSGSPAVGQLAASLVVVYCDSFLR